MEIKPMSAIQQSRNLGLAVLLLCGLALGQVGSATPGVGGNPASGAGSGNLSSSGSPANTQVGVFSPDGTHLTGYSGLTSDSSGNVTSNSIVTINQCHISPTGSDDTTNLQTCLSLGSSSVHVVVLPSPGVYNFNGGCSSHGTSSSILFVPTVSLDATLVNSNYATVEIRGLTGPAFNFTNTDGGGVIFKSNLASCALIGGGSSGASGFTGVDLIIDGIRFNTPANPSFPIIDATKIADVHIGMALPVQCDTGTAVPAALPTHSASACLITPTFGNPSVSEVGVLKSYGFYNGIIASEHVHMGHVTLAYGVNALTIQTNASNPSHDVSVDYLDAEFDSYDIASLASGAQAYTNSIQVSHLDSELDLTPFGLVALCNDANNALAGSVNYSVENFAAFKGTFTPLVLRSGCGNLRLNDLVAGNFGNMPLGTWDSNQGGQFSASLNPVNTILQTGNTLTLTTAKSYACGAAGCYNGYAAKVNSWPIGACIGAQMATTIPAGSAPTNFITLMDVGYNANNHAAMEVLNDVSSANQLYWAQVVGGTPTILNGSGSGVNYNASTHKYMRICNVAGQLVGSTSADGATWSSQGTTSGIFDLTGTIAPIYMFLGGGITANSTSPNTAYTVTWSNPFYQP